MANNFMKKAFTNDNWSKVADNYERTSASIMTHWVNNSLEIAHERVLKAVGDTSDGTPATFLDVGCGTGMLCLAFAEKYLTQPTQSGLTSNFQIIATDLADGMLARVDEKLNTQPRYQQFRSQITTVQMDGQLLDKLGDASVDVLGSNYGLSIFPDRVKGFGSAARVLKPGGVLFATVWDTASSNMRWVDGCARLAHEAMVTKNPGSAPPLFLPSMKVGHASIVTELQAAGFRDIEMFRLQHAIVCETPSAFVKALLGNPGFSGFIESAGREELEAFLYQSIADEAGFSAADGADHQNQKPKSVEEVKKYTRPVTIDFVGHVIVATK